MTDKQECAIKLAINIMNEHFDRHCNTAYSNLNTGVSVGYGEAINILSDMLSNADNHDCNCQHNNITANTNKVKVNSLEIIVRMISNKPYYKLRYKEIDKKDYSIGYSSYDLKIVLDYIDTYFEIVESVTNADRIRNMTDEELAEWINTKAKCEQCDGPCTQESCTNGIGILQWLQSKAE